MGTRYLTIHGTVAPPPSSSFSHLLTSTICPLPAVAEENGGIIAQAPSLRGTRMTVKLLAKWKEGIEVS